MPVISTFHIQITFREESFEKLVDWVNEVTNEIKGKKVLGLLARFRLRDRIPIIMNLENWFER